MDLRTRVLTGHLSLDREQELVAHAKRWIEGAAQTNPAMVEYLANFNAWRAVGDDDDPFLAEPVRSEGAVAREGAGG